MGSASPSDSSSAAGLDQPAGGLDLVDSHAHLDMAEFDADREAMLKRARDAGVRTLLAIAVNPDALEAALPFAERYDWIYAAAGLHPHEAKLATPALYEKLSGLAQHSRFLAWGEIGLDYHYEEPPREVQQRVFVEQLELARAARLPVVLHCRDAWEDCLTILEQHWRGAGLGGIFHCFTGTQEQARYGIEMGFLISFAGNVTYPKAQNLREVAGSVPLESLLIETDAPFLAPQGQRGRRNEPANVAEVAKTLGPVRNLPPAEVAAATAGNFRRFFGLG
jgi:TatD DNase family protein